MSRRVVVTGVGLVCGLGIGTDEVWKNLLAGKSGVRSITQFDTTAFDCTIAGEVRDFDPLHWVEKKELKKIARFIQLALAATDFAVRMADLKVTPDIAESTGVYVGSGIGGFDVIEREHSKLLQGGPGTHLTVFHSRGNHQSGFRAHFHPVRREGAEFGDGHGLLGVGARGGRFVPPDPARLCGSDDLRRRGSGHHADGRGRICRDEGALHAQRRAGTRQPPV